MEANWYLLIALALAAIVPLALIATRHELRRVRLRLVEELRSSLFKNQPDLPQLELVAARYRATSDEDGKTRQALLMVWTGAFFFFAVSAVGFMLLLVPSDWLLADRPDFPRITNAFLWTEADATREELGRVVTVAGLAFLGGFVFQLRYLVRATLNQELSALAFVRAALHILQGVIVALVTYRVIGFAVNEGEAGAWTFASALGLAFIVGYWPNLGLMKLAKALRVQIKRVDDQAMKDARLVPLDVIDGIDAETAFRLEESNLFDVQNLATVNPIGLYAETPFALLQCFDWVLQAQLCSNVGPRAFAELRKHKIRTIFDLERAVLAEGAPAPYLIALGGVIFHNASADFRAGLGLVHNGGDEASVAPEVLRHAVAIMADDLHVHRLRTLWRAMLQSTAGIAPGEPPWLYRTGPLPGEGVRPSAPDRDGGRGEAASPPRPEAPRSGRDDLPSSPP
ncbi:hypothetical protein SH591_13405 [Sphingomonas sp. LY54]|uniref:hypothetical protein n=1 Tax=Sphingomonas sp. LY54 TaxID=3095343 RepID=UPI002D781D6E|nr:hypothetical protein [Sphingomonas sp. LY54]WRP28091.1 hypothetical protein SH591_13405 [Sphingomonas sp. LY54]